MIDSVETMNEDSVKLDSLDNISLKEANTKTDESNNLEDGNDEQKCDFPPDGDILDMIESVNVEEPLPLVTERYFTPYYRINFPKKGDDICIRLHTNRLCMISLAPSHAIFNTNRKIVKIDFQVTENLNRADNAVSGKAKHGAQPLHATSKICSITCSDGQTWIVRCGMNGKLTEANTDLIENPELLRQPPHKGGYLAMVLPKLDAPEKMKNYLLTQEAYDKAILERSRDNPEDATIRINGMAKRSCDVEENGPKEKIMRIEDEQKVMDVRVESELSRT